MFLPSSSRKHIIVACRLNPSPRHSIQLVSDEPGAIQTFGSCMLALGLSGPLCSHGREYAYLAAMKSDLKNLASQEEIYYTDQYGYTSSFEDLGFVQSEGVTVVLYSSQTGWMAWATHAGLGPSEGCALYYSDAVTPTFAEVQPSAPGEMACTM